MERFEGIQHRLLHRIFRRTAIVQSTDGDSKQRPLISAHKFLESVCVTTQDGVNDGSVACFFHNLLSIKPETGR
jgi:hypothetical protein